MPSGLQVAFGGGINQYLQESSGFLQTITGDDFYEPGFNIMFPLEIQVSSTLDTLYVLVRERTNEAGTTFSTLSVSDLDATVYDATSGASVSSELSTNDVDASWDAFGDPLVLKISNVDVADADQATTLIRSLNVTITKASTSDSIFFNLAVLSSSQSFGYIGFVQKENNSRDEQSADGTRSLVNISPNGNYLLITPGGSISESSKDVSDFSYPKDAIYYSLSKEYNDEEYDWSISSYSHAVLRDDITVIPVPGYHKVGVVRVGGFVITSLANITGLIYVDVKAVGRISGAEDTFRVYLKKTAEVRVGLLS